MSYDPNWPQNGQLVDGDRFREQFGGLRDLIDDSGGVNAAQVDGVTPLPPGSAPAASVSVLGNTLHFTFDLPLGIDSAVVDSVGTGNPGDPASASLSLIGNTLHFAFSIPRGADGTPGSIINGAQVDSVSTLNPGDAATAGATYDGLLLRFAFGIPRGADGTNGAPGEVSNATLAAEIAGTVAGSSANSNGVGTLDTPFADADAEALRGKMNEMLLAMRRL